MKSLSILVLTGTLIAIIVGAIFAVTPVFANSSSQPAEAQAAEPVAPLTGSIAEPAAAELAVVEAEAAPVVAEDPGAALAGTFTIALEKERNTAATAEDAAAPPAAEMAAEDQATLAAFIASVSHGKANQVAGIYVDGVLAYSVSGQNGDASYVTTDPEKVTQFGLAAQYGSQAFLAHNYLAGASFSQLSVGQIVTLVYGDGSTANFAIDAIRHFQALSPDSTQSSFVDLNSGEELSASNLFHQMYNSDHSVVLQTCIANDGVSTWGRLFVIAVPLS